MKKIKLLMVFHSRINSEPLFRHLQRHEIEVTLVHTLREGLDLQKDFDLLLVDIDFSSTEGDGETLIPIFDEGERVEQLFDRPYAVFNFLKKVTTRTILFDSWHPIHVNAKLVKLGVEDLVTYIRGPLYVDELI